MAETKLNQIIQIGEGEELYHGSNVKNIERFLRSEYGSLGTGFYITKNVTRARYYAEKKAKNRGGEPMVYAAESKGIKLFNLAYTDGKELLRNFGEYLLERSKLERGYCQSWDRHDDSIVFGDEINDMCKSLGKEIIQNPSSFLMLLPRLTDFGEYNLTLAEFLKNRGYDGLALGEDYVLFDPSVFKHARVVD